MWTAGQQTSDFRGTLAHQAASPWQKLLELELGSAVEQQLRCCLFMTRRESSGGMEWLGVWNCNLSGSEFSDFGA